MKNREKFAKEILDIACSGGNIGIDKTTNKPIECVQLGCKNCCMAGDCMTGIQKWSESEYIEKPTITSKEKTFLDLLLSGKYIARDFDENRLFLYADKPSKKSTYWLAETRNVLKISDSLFDVNFDFIKWEDEEPWNIEDLKNLEVKDA